MNYKFLNKFLAHNFTRFFPKTVNRKLLRRFKIFFVPTKFKILPTFNYPITTNLSEQKELVNKFRQINQIIKFNTKKDMDIFLMKIFKKKKFNYFDIGGEYIDLYLKLNNVLNIDRYYLHNLDGIIDIFQDLKKHFNFKNLYPIKKITKLPKIDFVYFGSTIQYFSNYKLFLRKIFKIKPKYIFFSGTTCFEDKKINDTIVVKQTNILPHTHYLYFFNFNNFTQFFKKNGYKLHFKKKNKFADINYTNFSPELKKISYLDFLFVLKN